jgi:hypothetical protein
MSWKDNFHEAVRQWLIDNRGIDVAEVTLVHQELPSEWYCETCGPDPITVDITYLDSSGKARAYFWYGDLGEFINML